MRVGKKEAYLEGELRSKWEEWRAEWCWIIEENPHPSPPCANLQ